MTPKELGDYLYSVFGTYSKKGASVAAFIRMAYKYQNQKNGTNKNQMKFVPTLHQSFPVYQNITEEDIKLLKQKDPSMSFPNLSGLFLETGRPVTELMAITKNDISFQNHSLSICRSFVFEGRKASVKEKPRKEYHLTDTAEHYLNNQLIRHQEITSNHRMCFTYDYLFRRKNGMHYSLNEIECINSEFRMLTGNPFISITTLKGYLNYAGQNE